jgi:SAM-dependent methyltransferase
MPLIAVTERRHPPGRTRVPEPMVMDGTDSVAQFHEGGATSPGMLAVYDLNARVLDALVPEGGRLLDLGVGSGRALHRFLAMRPDVTATGVDLAPNMLDHARRLFDANGSAERVTLVEADLTALPDELADQPWDAISCVWALHHLPDADALRAALREIAQIRDGSQCAVWLLDFQRLRDPDTMRSVMAVLQPGMPPVLHADGVASEAAAFSHEEFRAELGAAGLRDLEAGISRPIPWLQAFWSHPRRDEVRAGARRHPGRLPGPARGDAVVLRRGFSKLPL